MIVFVEVGSSSLLMEPSLHERLGFWSQSTKGKFGFQVDKTTNTREKKICKNDSGTQRHLSDMQLYLASSFRSKKEDAWL